MGLKGIDTLITPDLLKVIYEMGHGDEIVFADLHFPAASVAKAKGAILCRLDGHGIPEILKAVLKLFPLDEYVETPAAIMDRVSSDKAKNLEIPIWKTYQEILANEKPDIELELVERFQFYERAKNAYAVVATGEVSKYANIILKKGLVPVNVQKN